MIGALPNGVRTLIVKGICPHNLTYMQCNYKRQNNIQCKGNAMLNAEFCYFHNPAIAEADKQKSRVAGGKNNAVAIAEPLEPLKIETTADVVILLTQTVNLIRGGKMEVRVANCLGVLSGHLIKAFEVSDLEKRIEKIENTIEQRN